MRETNRKHKLKDKAKKFPKDMNSLCKLFFSNITYIAAYVNWFYEKCLPAPRYLPRHQKAKG
jgi:hypothetical protein